MICVADPELSFAHETLLSTVLLRVHQDMSPTSKMASKDSHLYNRPTYNLNNGKEISSSTTLAFTSQLSSLISNPSNTSKPTSSRIKPKKDDLFRRPNRNTAKRAKLDEDASPHFEQKHTTNGEALDKNMWERSKRKMEEKARLYAAMKRGDVEDMDEKYTVDFDKKWAESHEEGKQSGSEDDDAGSEDDDAGSDDEEHEIIEYTDEFGRTRTGTRATAARSTRIQNSKADLASDRFTARPSAPSNVIRGDTIQHQAFNPDEGIYGQMEDLARKRDKSLTPPPEEHFDATKEVRSKGTGFFQFSDDVEERRRQQQGLEDERAETERRRKERQERLDERKRQIEERREELQARRGKRKADDFLEELGEELAQRQQDSGTEVTERIEAAMWREEIDEDG